MSYERKCIVDLTNYRYCNQCNEFNPDETWRFLFCCENCRNIYRIVDEYDAKKITANEAKEKLEKCDLTKIDSFQKFVKRDIERMFSEATEEETVDGQEGISATIHVDENSSISNSFMELENNTVTVIKPRGLRRKTAITEEKIDE